MLRTLKRILLPVAMIAAIFCWLHGGYAERQKQLTQLPAQPRHVSMAELASQGAERGTSVALSGFRFDPHPVEEDIDHQGKPLWVRTYFLLYPSEKQVGEKEMMLLLESANVRSAEGVNAFLKRREITGVVKDRAAVSFLPTVKRELERLHPGVDFNKVLIVEENPRIPTAADLVFSTSLANGLGVVALLCFLGWLALSAREVVGLVTKKNVAPASEAVNDNRAHQHGGAAGPTPHDS